MQQTIDLNYIKDLLKNLGFSPKEGEVSLWFKAYEQHGSYEISVNLENIGSSSRSIDYGKKVKVRRATILSLTKPENLVSLECIDRLLELGYSPERITLEKSWNLGHRGKGFLDIFVRENDGSSFMMIECKTWGQEFNNEKQKMLKDGGQLFSYLQQDQGTKFIVLYSSKLEVEKISFQYDFVSNKDDFRGKSVEDVYEIWDKSFESKGLLERGTPPYGVQVSGIKDEDLRDIEPEVGGLIFNQFAEILRRHVVSDKTNAFNKIFNLFLCKIVDEDNNKNTSEEMAFQWKRTDTLVSLFGRLNDLYKQGLQNYLGMDVTDYSEDYIDQQLSDFQNSGTRDEIKKIITELRLYKDNEFAFKEVYNKETFELNALVVKEVVELLQSYRIRYSSKQQYLGDFFELLLNTGIKQEAGQFFTPIPIARFICRSIPIDEVIKTKNDARETRFLPYVIDYASGSGHFLTEMMDEINFHIDSVTDENIHGGRRAVEIFNSEKSNYLWAKEYIYGIEKDNRLAKTTKISTFLNGDGDARIISGDGLDNFGKSDKYVGVLKSQSRTQDNQVFDILVANPPYSVDGFKNTLSYGDETFELYKYLTDKSAEIECLFVERAKQLVKDNGYAGIILPSSLLTNSGIYDATRSLLLKYFDIKAIVSLGGGTFMATNTNTVIMFLQRKKAEDWVPVKRIVDNFFVDFRDSTCNRIENAFSSYVKEVFDNWTLSDYVKFLKREAGEKIVNHDIFKEYKDAFEDSKEYKNLTKSQIYKQMSAEEKQNSLDEIFYKHVWATEKEKLFAFMLTYNKQVVLVSSGSKEVEKAFLGYEFSNRRGHEGIKLYKDKEGKIANKLYSEDDILDSTKVNSYIYKNYMNLPINVVDESLGDHVSVDSLHTLMEFDQANFSNRINVRLKKKLKFESKFPLTKIRKLDPEYVQGVIYEKKDESRSPTDKVIVTASNIDLETGQLDLEEKRYLRNNLQLSENHQLKSGDIFVCTSSGSLRHLGKSTFIDKSLDVYFGGFCAVLRFHDDSFSKYVSIIFKTPEFRSYVESQLGQNINNLGKNYLLDFKLPVLPPDLCQEVVGEIEKIEKTEEEYKVRLEEIKSNIHSIMDTLFSNGNLERLGNAVTFLKRGKTPEYGFSKTRVIKSGQVRGYFDFDFSQKYYVTEDFILDERLLKKGDLLVNSTGVGTAGRVNYFDLEGSYVVDTHVSILRVNEDLVLPKFALYCFGYIGFDKLEQLAEGRSGQIELSPGKIRAIRFPLIGDIQKQNEALVEIDKLQKEMDEAKKVINSFEESKVDTLRRYIS